MSPSDLQQPVLLSLLGAGFVTAFLHAALPTHWLPFVLVGRGQRWTLPQVLTATRLKQTPAEVPGSMTVLDSELINASGARDISELLRLVPGMMAMACASPMMMAGAQVMSDMRRMDRP